MNFDANYKNGYRVLGITPMRLSLETFFYIGEPNDTLKCKIGPVGEKVLKFTIILVLRPKWVPH